MILCDLARAALLTSVPMAAALGVLPCPAVRGGGPAVRAGAADRASAPCSSSSPTRRTCRSGSKTNTSPRPTPSSRAPRSSPKSVVQASAASPHGRPVRPARARRGASAGSRCVEQHPWAGRERRRHGQQVLARFGPVQAYLSRLPAPGRWAVSSSHQWHSLRRGPRP